MLRRYIIYKIVNLVNGKIYIGQTYKTLKERWDGHKNPSKATEMLISRAIKKYGRENFKMYEFDYGLGQEMANAREIYWIKFFNSTNKKIGYNILLGGNQAILPEKSRMKIAGKIIRGKNQGAFFDKERNSWRFDINFRKKIIRRGFQTKLDAQIARDIEIIQLFKPNEAKLMLIYPENLEKYLSGKIKYPERIMGRELKKSNYNWVQWDDKHKQWYIKIKYNNGLKSIKKGMFSEETEAAQVADYLNIKHNQYTKEQLNFPEKYDYYISPNFEMPKTVLQKKKRAKYTFVGVYQGNFCIDLRSQGIKYRKYGIKTIEDARILRNKVLIENNKPIPD